METTAVTDNRFRRWIKRFLIAVFALPLILIAAVFAYGLYLEASFDTKTLPARYGQVDSQLYLSPSNAGRQPLLVLLGGGEGGNAWTSDRWAAQRERLLTQGYALLAVGYFGLPNTPANLDRIALEGVHGAIRSAAANPQIDGQCVAVIGGSRGAELALLLASHFDDIRAVVALAPASSVFVGHSEAFVTSAFALNGEQLPFVPMLWSATPQLLVGDIGGVMRKLAANRSAMETAAIPVERINGPVLLVSGAEDEMWPAREMSLAIIQRLDRHGFVHVHEHLDLPGGHMAPADEFPRIEAFLNAHFVSDSAGGECGRR
jgi:acetyl esterase/lipase